MVTPVAAVCMSTSGDVRHAPALTQLDVPIKYLVAGGVAGGVARTSVAPLSRLKVLVQVNSNSIQYTSVLSGLRQIVRSEGLRGLYIGNGADCIRIVPHSAAKFLCYEHLIARADSWIARHPGSEAWQPALRVASGSAAGIIAGTLTYPLDMIRGRLMVQGPNGVRSAGDRYSGVVHAAQTIARKEGVMTLYRGWLPSFVGTVLYSGLKFGIYETLKDALASYHGLRDARELGLPANLAAGAVAGGAGQTVAYPLEVTRRRLQAGSCRPRLEVSASGAQAMVYPGMVACIRSMVRSEGWGSLYKGLSLNYIRVVPGVAISFATYDAMKDLLQLQGPLSAGSAGVSGGGY